MAPNLKTSATLSSGHQMPVVGLGTWQAKDPDEVELAVKTAIEVGYRHIDTAYVYMNENQIGKALKEVLDEGKVKRSDLFIVTKLPSNGHKDVEYFCRKSLKALQLDYVDLYLIHSPVSSQRGENDDDFIPRKDGKFLYDHSTDLIRMWKDMECVVDKGLARSIGISNFNSKQIQKILDNCRIKPANLQVECHVYLPQYELHDFCKKHGISFTAYSPLGSPGLPAYMKNVMNLEKEMPNLLADPKLKELADKNSRTPGQVLIRYLLQRGIIVIPKSTNPIRIKENFEVMDFSLSDEDMNTLKNMQTGFRYFEFDFPPGFTDHPEYPFKESF